MAIFSNGQSSRSRLGRVAQFELSPNRFEQTLKSFQRGDVLARFAVVLCAGIVMWTINLSWRPPFPYRLSQVPSRDIVARDSFTKVDPVKTREAKDRARRSIECVYRHDPQPLVELRAAVKGKLFRLLSAESTDDFDEAWQEFVSGPDSEAGAGNTADTRPALVGQTDHAAAATEPVAALNTIDGFKQHFASDPQLENFEHEMADAFANIERFGLLRDLQHDVADGSHSEITILSPTEEKSLPRVSVENVRLTEAVHRLKKNLDEKLSVPGLASLVFQWVKPRLPTTLTFDRDSTKQTERRALDGVSDVLVHFEAGKDVLATAGTPLGSLELGLLRLEYDTRLDQLKWRESLIRSAGAAGMYLAVFVLCGTYLYWRDSPLLQVLRRYYTMLGLVVFTFGLARVCSQRSVACRAGAVDDVRDHRGDRVPSRGRVSVDSCFVFVGDFGPGAGHGLFCHVRRHDGLHGVSVKTHSQPHQVGVRRVVGGLRRRPDHAGSPGHW